MRKTIDVFIFSIKGFRIAHYDRKCPAITLAFREFEKNDVYKVKVFDRKDRLKLMLV